MNAEMAACLALTAGQRVSVRASTKIAMATSVLVEPATSDDWEVLELHADYLEEQLLNQVNVLTIGQTIPIWVHNTTIIRLKIVETTPDATVRLSKGAEIIIAPKPRHVPSTRSAISLIPRYLLVQDTVSLSAPGCIGVSRESLAEYEWHEGDIVQILKRVYMHVYLWMLVQCHYMYPFQEVCVQLELYSPTPMSKYE
eukprot:gene15193-17979_t